MLFPSSDDTSAGFRCETACEAGCDCRSGLSRRQMFGAAGSAALLPTALTFGVGRAQAADAPINLAVVAKASSSYTSGDTRNAALNDASVPKNSADNENGSYGNWPKVDTQWVEYEWSLPVTIASTDVYWWIDGQGVGAPRSCKLLYWDGTTYLPVKNPKGLGVVGNTFNATTFDTLKTTRLRLEITSDGKLSTGILEWRVFNAGIVPAFPPAVASGIDRSVIMGGKTYLAGKAVLLGAASDKTVLWSKVSGPGDITFADRGALETTATFSTPGEYVLGLAAKANGVAAESTLRVRAEPAPPKSRLDVVYTKAYSIDSPLWNARAKALIVNWIPHCIAYCERTDLPIGQGGIDNFIEAGKALRGEPHAPHKGYVFANAWVHQTVESMCIAQMVDAQGDPEILAAQAHMKATLARWIPIILAAQEPDGYMQTAYTLAKRSDWPERWSPEFRGNHEGYTAGYFIESAINHYTLTDGSDLRLYNGAKKLADCWVANIGPGKKEWFDGHQEMEQALVRFGRFVNDTEGNGRGDAYIRLARFLLDSRKGGQEYDQSHQPPIKQYEAVGHAVRATYFYSGMADIAAETGDTDYMSAVMSLWDNMVNKKYYVTGGIGSGETSEGFGPNYSLPNNAYCESCSSCGLIFFQYKLNLAYHDAKYADLYEQTMYNALLGGVDLDGKHFCYTNPLVNTERTLWHVCPCCVGNIPRTLLMVPTWTYAKSAEGLYVNMFIGSRITVENVAGTNIEMVQKTDYPWNGQVAITVNPKESRTFTLYVRIPDRTVSALYTTVPPVRGVRAFTVNGQPVMPEIEKGYAKITRTWAAGDQVAFELPMEPQRITADARILADRGRAALAYGPLIYNVETADQAGIEQALGSGPLKAEWRGDLLGGVMVIRGTWADGSTLLAIPNFARMNRVGGTQREIGAGSVDYAPGTSIAPGADTPDTERESRPIGLQSQVWMRI